MLYGLPRSGMFTPEGKRGVRSDLIGMSSLCHRYSFDCRLSAEVPEQTHVCHARIRHTTLCCVARHVPIAERSPV
jgi:hypothetical protein